MYQSIVNNSTQKFEDAMIFLKAELAKIRTGRANTGMLDSITVEAYGAQTPIQQIASVTVPEPRVIMIQAWDQNIMEAIETALRNSDLGLTPNNDGKVIRLNIPQLTEERRAEIVKIMNGKTEDARITIRNIREDVWQEIQKAEKAGDISEDDKFQAKDALQKKVDEINKQIEELRTKKEEDIMTV